MQKLVVVVRVCICKVKPVDIRLTNTSIADRQRFMQLLVKHGIKGIGAYFPAKDGGYFIHADLGGKRQWGSIWF